jgi:hypothetical protein
LGSGCAAIQESRRANLSGGIRTANWVASIRGRPRDFLVSDIDIVKNISYQKNVRPARRYQHLAGPNHSEMRLSHMATSQNNTPPSRFHNLGDAALADELGRVDSIFKAAEAELKALKDEFKARGLSAVTGYAFSVTATEQIAGRLDAKAVRDYLGAAYSRFEVAVVSTVIRIKAANRTLPIAA